MGRRKEKWRERHVASEKTTKWRKKERAGRMSGRSKSVSWLRAGSWVWVLDGIGCATTAPPECVGDRQGHRHQDRIPLGRIFFLPSFIHFLLFSPSFLSHCSSFSFFSWPSGAVSYQVGHVSIRAAFLICLRETHTKILWIVNPFLHLFLSLSLSLSLFLSLSLSLSLSRFYGIFHVCVGDIIFSREVNIWN